MDLQNNLTLLAHTPAALNALLRNLPTTWTEANEGGDSWTITDILGHLVHTESTDWMQRMHTILEHGESVPFTPLDRTAFRNNPQSLTERLDTFIALRNQNLYTVHALNLTDADLQRRGIHPNFGPVTFGELLSTWATHDLTHLHQITRVLAYQNRETVGPWKAFLGVLKCSPSA